MHEALERALKVFGLAREVGDEIGCDLSIAHGSARGANSVQAARLLVTTHRFKQVGRIGERAVVSECESACLIERNERLGHLEADIRVFAAGGIAHVPDRSLSLQCCDGCIVEHLTRKTKPLFAGESHTIAHCDASRFLPAVLQRLKAEEGEARNIRIGRPDAEHTAGFMKRIVGAFWAGRARGVDLESGAKRRFQLRHHRFLFSYEG